MSAENLTTPKPCTACRVVKPLSEYGPDRRTRDGRSAKCRECCRDIQRAYWSTPEAKARLKVHEKRSKLKYRYGISERDFAELLDRQHGVCAICGLPPAGTAKTRRLHVDHDHETGRIRGLLCLKCNSALAQFGDRIEGVTKAVDYLQRRGD